MMTKLYKRRSDGTVLAHDVEYNILTVYRLAPGTMNETEAVNVPRESAQADWTRPSIHATGSRVDRVVLDMLQGTQPKVTHGWTGAKVGAGVGIVSALAGGPLGPVMATLVGFLGGAWLGSRARTAARWAIMDPAIPVDAPVPEPPKE